MNLPPASVTSLPSVLNTLERDLQGIRLAKTGVEAMLLQMLQMLDIIREQYRHHCTECPLAQRMAAYGAICEADDRLLVARRAVIFEGDDTAAANKLAEAVPMLRRAHALLSGNRTR